MTETESNIDVLTRALSFAFLTGDETPVVIPLATLRKYATVLDACGVKQTSAKKRDEIPSLPKWMRKAQEEASGTLPQRIDPAKMPGAAQVSTVPKVPKRIPKAARATRVTPQEKS